MAEVGEQSVISIAGMEKAKVVSATALEIGPVRLQELKLLAVDIGFIRDMLGYDEIDGVIGFDLLSQCICEIELAKDLIRIYDEVEYGRSLGKDVAWQPLEFYQNIPLISARFPQGEGIFRIDVGASGNMIFHGPAVKRFAIPVDSLPKVTSGATELAIGKIEWFELGGKRFTEPDVIYALAKDGPLAEASIDGNIGVEFLRPFRIVLDYRGGRLGMMPVESK